MPPLFLSVIVLVSWTHPPSLTVFYPRFLTACYVLPGCRFRRVFLPLIRSLRSSLSSVLSFHADN